MAPKRRNTPPISEHLDHINNTKTPRWAKIGMGALAAVWWMSPVDDVMLPYLLIADEAVLTGLAAWVGTGGYDKWRDKRRAKKLGHIGLSEAHLPAIRRPDNQNY